MVFALKGLNLFWGWGQMKDVHMQLQIPEKNANKKSKICTSYGNQRRLCGRGVI